MAQNQNFWIKSIKDDQFPKLYNGSLHIYKTNQLLSVLIKNDKLTILLINKNKFVIEEMFEPNMDACQTFDHNFISNKQFIVNNKMYLIKNCLPNDNESILILDLKAKTVFPIKNDDHRQKTFRMNYSVEFYDYKLYFFGGFDQNMKCVNTFEYFDIILYRWFQINAQQNIPSPRHSHTSCIHKNLMYIIGGLNTQDFFQNSQSYQDIYTFNFELKQWNQIIFSYQNIPKYLAENYSFMKDSNLIILWSDKCKEQYDIIASQLDLKQNIWQNVEISGQSPLFKYGAASVYDVQDKQFYLYGGFQTNMREQNAISNQFEILSFDLKGLPNVVLLNEQQNKKITNIQTSKEKQNQDHSNLWNDLDGDQNMQDEELTFEQLLEREKKLMEQEKIDQEEDEKKAKKKSKKKGKKK